MAVESKRMRQLGRTSAEWVSENPTLEDREIAFEKANTGSPYLKMKVGPGAYGSLGYFSSGHIVKNAGSVMTQRTAMNFTGFTIADDGANDETDISIAYAGSGSQPYAAHSDHDHTGVYSPVSHLHDSSYMALDGDNGLIIGSATNIAAGGSPITVNAASLADKGIVVYSVTSGTGTVTLNFVTATVASGQAVKKPIRVINATGSDITVAFNDNGSAMALDGVLPNMTIAAAGGVATFIVYTESAGSAGSWRLIGDEDIATLSQKASPVAADRVRIADSADSFRWKWGLLSSLLTSIHGVALAANQYLTKNTSNSATEARTDKRAMMWSAPITANGTYPIGLWGHYPITLTQVTTRTVAGTCSIQIRKNGTAINGFVAAIAQTATLVNTTSTEALVENDFLDVVVTNASSLTGLAFTIKSARTGN